MYTHECVIYDSWTWLQATFPSESPVNSLPVTADMESMRCFMWGKGQH